MSYKDFWRRPQALVLTVALTLGMCGIGFAAAERIKSENPAVVLKLANPDEAPSRTGFAPVVKRVLPAVVNIASSKLTKAPTALEGQMPDDDFFQQFFGRQQGRQFRTPRGAPEQGEQQREHGLGSGVIMTPDGYILTNNHVVDGATDVQVILGDKREFKARVVGKDARTDVAVLKIDATNLPCITIGDSSKVQVGDYALAIGDPFGVGQTVTMGIISATGRSNLGIEDYEDFIQTDAPINPGNSGGALVNDRGELIGMNTAIIAHGSQGNQGIGFAVPVNLARNVMDQLVKTGTVSRAYLGILPQNVTPAIARAFGDKYLSGALVGDVTAGSPAEKSGIEKGDIITDVDGKQVTDANNLRMTISTMMPGTTVNVKVFRNGAEKQMAVKLAELPTTEAANTHENQGESNSVLSGVAVEDLDAQTARELKLPANTQGVVVTNVKSSSAAAEAGLKSGDVIQEVNRKPVKSTADFERAIHASKDQTLLLVNRNGSTMFLAV